MPRAHRLQHVESFRAAHFAHDDAVGTHAQAIDHQLPHRDISLAPGISGMSFHPHDVPLLQLQFRGVSDRDDAFVVGNITGEHVEKRGLRYTS
jgi:hypothetical protein